MYLPEVWPQFGALRNLSKFPAQWWRNNFMLIIKQISTRLRYNLPACIMGRNVITIIQTESFCQAVSLGSQCAHCWQKFLTRVVLRRKTQGAYPEMAWQRRVGQRRKWRRKFSKDLAQKYIRTRWGTVSETGVTLQWRALSAPLRNGFCFVRLKT